MNKIFKNQRPAKKTSRKKPRTLWKTLAIGCLFLSLTGLLLSSIGAAVLYFKYSKELPDVRMLKEFQPSTITKLYSDSDELIAEFYIEKRILIPGEKIPLKMKQATLAVEDSHFYFHFGIDPKAIIRAFIANFKAGRVVEGGSTITQQLAKTLFLTRDRNITRKIKEAILAIRLELIFSKDEILEIYLNQIYYGHGSYGIEAASRTYFGKTAEDLTIEECALLASLPKAPNNYTPYRHPERAKKRRNHALRRMAKLGFITQVELEEGQNSEFQLGEITGMLNRAPYFVEYIRQFLQETYGSKKIYRDGLGVYTTLNIEFQEMAQQAVQENLLITDKRYGYRGPLGTVDLTENPLALQETFKELNGFKENEEISLEKELTLKGIVLEVTTDDVLVGLGKDEGIIELKDMNWARKPNNRVDGRWAKITNARKALSPGDLVLVKVLGPRQEDLRWSLSLEQEPEVQAGLVSLEAETGHIKAMVGGYNFSKSQFNRAVQAIRQPGSAFKPIIYASAIKEGFTPASIVIDSPIIFKEKVDAFDKWKPVNFEKKFYGPTSIRTALTHSRNIVTVKLLQEIGVGRAIQMARDLGITSPLSKNLSISLGSSGMTLLELTSAYSAFANQGEKVSPAAVRIIENRKGELLYSAQPEVTNPISSGLAYTVTSLMQSVVQNGTAKKVKALNRPIAGKTGTTNKNVDAWFIGFSPEIVTGVWVGRDNYEPLGVNETGSRAAIPIWLQYMKYALNDTPKLNFPVSRDIVFTKINPETGDKASFSEPDSRFEAFMDDFDDEVSEDELETGLEEILPLNEENF
jgi:penicillin-binding protein 1A